VSDINGDLDNDPEAVSQWGGLVINGFGTGHEPQFFAALPLPGPDASATYDAKHLCRELVRQGRLAQAKVYAARLDDPTHRAYACLGVAQGLLAKPAGQPDQ